MHTLARLAFSCIMPALLFVAGFQSCSAATFRWIDPAGGTWSDAANWTLFAGAGTPPPDVGDIAQFDLASTYTVSYPSGLFASTIWQLDEIRALNGIVTLQGGVPSLAGGATSLNLLTGTAELEVNGGHLILLAEPGSFDANSLGVDVGALVNVRDGLLDLDYVVSLDTPRLSLGASALGETGELRIFRGATLSVTAPIPNIIGFNGAAGILNVDDGVVTLAGTTELGVSGSGSSNGTILAANSSSLTLDSIEMGGTVAGATGTITLSESASLQQTGASTWLIGGSGGAGIVNVQDNALLDSGTGNITLSSTGTVNLSGGTLQADGFLDFQGGTLNMSGGELIVNAGMDAITAGGVLNLTGGTVRVAGGLSKLETSLNFGSTNQFDPATVIVEEDQASEVQFAFRIGSDAGTFGRAELHKNSTLTGTGGGAGADLIVGESGHGQLAVGENAVASFRDDFLIAANVGSTGFATVRHGGRVSVTAGSGASISIAPAGTGSLTIENGGLVETSTDVFLASQATGNVNVTLLQGSCSILPSPFAPTCRSTPATLQSGDDLFVGGGTTTAGGTAELNILAGGLVAVPDLLRIYNGGTVNLSGGTIEVGTLEFQGAGVLNLTGGELRFPGDTTFGSTVSDGIVGVAAGEAAGLVNVIGTLTVAGPWTVDGYNVAANAMTVNATLTHVSRAVTVDALNLSAAYVLDGGHLTLRTATNLDPNFDFQSGTLELTDTQLTVGAGGLLGSLLAISSGQTVINQGATLVESAGQLQLGGGTFDSAGAMTVATGAGVTNQGTIIVRDDLVVEPGASFSNVDTVSFEGPAVPRYLSGSVNNSGTLSLVTPQVLVPASGLALDGNGAVRSDTSTTPAALTGETPASTISNNGNTLLGSGASAPLQVAGLVLQNGPTAAIGNHVQLVDVAMSGGNVSGTNVSAGGAGGTSFDGVVTLSGQLTATALTVNNGSELRVASGGELMVDGSGGGSTPLTLQGLLRAEAGGTIVLDARTHDFTGGGLSLANDATHNVAAGATVLLAGPLLFDSLTIGANPAGFVPALFGADPVIAAGEALEVLGVTSLDKVLTLNGGSFTTGGLSNFANLDLRSGTLRLTGDDLLVGSSAVGDSLVVPTGVNLIVDTFTETGIGTRLIVAGGAFEGNALDNLGDTDVIDGTAAFTGAASNIGDFNAIDATLNFSGGLMNSGALNLINSSVSGPLINSGEVALAGTNTFEGHVSGSGDFTGSGTAVFESILSPGDSPAVVSFDGDVVLTATAELQMELAGRLVGSEYDQLAVGGVATLAGTLDVTLLSGFTPSFGDTFELLQAGSIAGAFDTIDLPPLAGRLVWHVDQSAESLSLSVVLAGDYNQDGVVNFADYTVWRDNLGSAVSLPGDDTPGVAADDYARWKANFGAVPPPASAFVAAPVPEPTSIGLAAVLLLIAQWGRTAFPIRSLRRCLRK